MAFKAPPRIRYIASPNHSPRPGGADDITTIVMHETCTTGSPDAVAYFFRSPSAGVSAHYTIGRTGRIVQSVRDSQQAWHAGASSFRGRHHVNQFSIGIEMVNKGNGKQDYPDVQIVAAAWLVDHLMKKHPKIKFDNITDHRAVLYTHANSDMSKSWPWAKFRRYIRTKPWQRIALTDKDVSVPRQHKPHRAGWWNLGLIPYIRKLRAQGKGKRIEKRPETDTVVIPVPKKRPSWWGRMFRWKKSQR